MNDHGMIGRPPLDGVETSHRFFVRRVGAEAIDGLGRERYESAGAEDLRGLADLGFHGLGSSAFLTASDCFARKSTSFLFSSESVNASMAMAYSAALAAPASPMAKVATGIPLGIWTVERSESRPCR